MYMIVMFTVPTCSDKKSQSMNRYMHNLFKKTGKMRINAIEVQVQRLGTDFKVFANVDVVANFTFVYP